VPIPRARTGRPRAAPRASRVDPSPGNATDRCAPCKSRSLHARRSSLTSRPRLCRAARGRRWKRIGGRLMLELDGSTGRPLAADVLDVLVVTQLYG
jgi:hypothetical protein